MWVATPHSLAGVGGERRSPALQNAGAGWLFSTLRPNSVLCGEEGCPPLFYSTIVALSLLQFC